MRISLRLTAVITATLAIAFGLTTVVQTPGVRAQGAPAVSIQSPAAGATVANPVQMHISSSGATIKAATDGDAAAAHYHYFIDRDPATVLQPGQPIPAGQADIIHTNDANLTLPNLSPGQHTVWVVLAHTDHTPFAPNVQAQVAFTVGAAAAATPASPAAAAQAATPNNGLPQTGTAGLLSSQRRSVLLPATLLLAALLLGLGGLGLVEARTGSRRGR